MINDWMKIILQRNHSFSFEKNIATVAQIPKLLKSIPSAGYTVKLIYFPMPEGGIDEAMRRGIERDKREGRPPPKGMEVTDVYKTSYKVRDPSVELDLKPQDSEEKAWTNLTEYVNDKYPSGNVELTEYTQP
jgi:hypothetical protein